MYLVGLHIYYKMIHGPYNIKLPLILSLIFYDGKRSPTDSDHLTLGTADYHTQCIGGLGGSRTLLGWENLLHFQKSNEDFSIYRSVA